MHIFKDIFRNRKLVFYLAKNDFKTKYAGSYFGIVWAFIQPLITIILYWFVFQVALENPPIVSANGDEIPFILWLSSGLIPWFFFQEAVTLSANSFLEYSYLVKKVLFDIKVLPMVKIISSLFVHIFFILLLMVFYIAYGRFPGIVAIQVVYYSFGMFMLALSIAYFTSAVAIFFKDTTQIITIVMQVGVWMTPIMWNFEAMKHKIPTALQGIFKLNPMYYIVDGYRGTLIDGRWFFHTPYQTIYFWSFVLIMFLISGFVYKRLKPHFSDSL